MEASDQRPNGMWESARADVPSVGVRRTRGSGHLDTECLLQTDVPRVTFSQQGLFGRVASLRGWLQSKVVGGAARGETPRGLVAGPKVSPCCQCPSVQEHVSMRWTRRPGCWAEASQEEAVRPELCPGAVPRSSGSEGTTPPDSPRAQGLHTPRHHPGSRPAGPAPFRSQVSDRLRGLNANQQSGHLCAVRCGTWGCVLAPAHSVCSETPRELQLKRACRCARGATARTCRRNHAGLERELG